MFWSVQLHCICDTLLVICLRIFFYIKWSSVFMACDFHQKLASSGALHGKRFLRNSCLFLPLSNPFSSLLGLYDIKILKMITHSMWTCRIHRKEDKVFHFFVRTTSWKFPLLGSEMSLWWSVLFSTSEWWLVFSSLQINDLWYVLNSQLHLWYIGMVLLSPHFWCIKWSSVFMACDFH